MGCGDMKYVFIDTNLINNDGSYYIWDGDIKTKKLNVGDEVIAYQEKDSWVAEIVVSDNGYGVVLKSEAKEITDERFEGHVEGFNDGMSVQKQMTINVLENLEIAPEIIAVVKEKFGI